MDFGTKYNEKGLGVSPFIEAPCITQGVLKSCTLEEKDGKLKIVTVVTETRETEGLEDSVYGKHRRCNTTIICTEKTWTSIINPLILKFIEHFKLGDPTALMNKFSDAFNNFEGDDQAKFKNLIEKVVSFINGTVVNKPALWVIKGDASYKIKEGGGYYRNVYPSINWFGSTVRPVSAENLTELEKYLSDNRSFLFKDEGEPKTNLSINYSASTTASNEAGNFDEVW